MSNTTQSIFLLFLAQACVGINIVLSKGLINHINPIIMLTIRFSFASMAMLILLLLSKENNKYHLKFTRKEWLVLLVKGLGAGIFFNLIMLCGLYFTNANSAGLITSLLPAIVITISILCFKQKLSRRIVIALAISLAGLILINLGTVDSTNTKNALIGNLLVLAALVPDGFYYTLSKYYPLKINPIYKVLLLNLINLPFLYLIVFFMPATYWSILNLHDWLMMLIIGLTSSLFFVFWQKGVKNIDAAYSALSTAFMPLATVILAWIILGETLTVTKLIGMLLVILSIISYARR
jgi:drug/metabolite transporter (DMT)-like permease